MTDNIKYIRYFLILSFVVGIAVPSVMGIAGHFIEVFPEQTEELTMVYKAVDKLKGNMDKAYQLGFVFYYMLGFYLSRVAIQKKHVWVSLALAIIGLLFTAFATQFLSVEKGALFDLYGYTYFHVMLEATGVFVLFLYLFRQYKPRSEAAIRQAVLPILGVYCIHLLIMDVLNVYFHINVDSANPALMVPLLGGGGVCAVVAVCSGPGRHPRDALAGVLRLMPKET